MAMRVGIVGCGLIGHKRAKALGEHTLVATADVDLTKAAQLAALHPDCEPVPDWRSLVARSDIDAVIISTTNNSLALIAEAAVQAGKHVLIEKPAARNAKDLAPVVNRARNGHIVVKGLSNPRCHPAFLMEGALLEQRAVLDVVYARGRNGDAQRLVHDKED